MTQFLGIGYENKAIYCSGNRSGLERISPNPVSLAFNFVNEKLNDPSAFMEGFPNRLFIEESFDPITKVRRGRLYRIEDACQPQEMDTFDQLGKSLGHHRKIVTYQRDPLLLLSKVGKKKWKLHKADRRYRRYTFIRVRKIDTRETSRQAIV